MILTEENYAEKISSLNRQDWQPLFDLIPEIENTSKFGDMAGGEKDENGGIQLPYRIEKPIVSQFHRMVYELPVIISFDWVSWDEGRKMLNSETFDFETIDIPTKCKLITAIVRNNRFCEGALVAEFESGLILKILKSIQKQYNLLNLSH